MILIKDRHNMIDHACWSLQHIGKYDTYKGSTRTRLLCLFHGLSEGNMILIKDRHCIFGELGKLKLIPGKYDTYKGSTLSITLLRRIPFPMGNMIFIKDRHGCSSLYASSFCNLENMILRRT